MRQFLEELRRRVEALIDFEVAGGIEHRYEISNYADGEVSIKLRCGAVQILEDLREKLERELGGTVSFDLIIEIEYGDELLRSAEREALNRILKRGDFVNEGDMIVVDIDDEVAFINEYENGIGSSASATIMCSVRVLEKIGHILSEVGAQ